jgi:hypothetical protein
MTLLVRKISKAKWYQLDIAVSYDVSADALTNCLRTTKNTLSVWKIDTEDDLNQAVLALVANQDHLAAIDVVILEESSLSQYNLKIIASPGDTPVESLVNEHRDIAELSYNKIGHVTNHIVDRIRSNHIKRYTISMLKKVLKDAIEAGLIKKEDLKVDVQKKLPE